MAERSELPFGSEFSPSQIELPVLLDFAISHDGDVKSLQSAIQARFFTKHGGGNAENQKKLAMNCRLGMKAYGLIDENANVSDFGRELYAMKDDSSKLYESLARYILLHLKGMALVQCIRDMTAAGEVVNLTTLREGRLEFMHCHG
jgi:site-specific DNA-methyltransferase (cytosine-N4-specific)